MAQVGTVPVTLRTVIRSADFVRGFKEAKAGKPINYDYSPKDTNGLWQYERGRQFGLIFDGKLKSGNRILYRAELELSNAIFNKIII